MKVVYFANDLNDPAIYRRVGMLRAGGAEVAMLGFNRAKTEPPVLDSVVPLVIGHTADARLAQRIVAVFRALARLNRHRALMQDADLVLARSLEMFLLGTLSRNRFAPQARMVYECLDVHKLLIARSNTGRVLRSLEARLLRQSQLVIVSSRAFVEHYFKTYHATFPPTMLIENKVLEAEAADVSRSNTPASVAPLPAGPPWRIGWFGVLRCHRSLHALAELCRQYPGEVEVIMRGRPALTVMPDFHEVIAQTPGMVFHGPYDRRTDLGAIYGEVHLTWAIDYYEAGGNSQWLLPNRLYEGTLYGAVPMALGSVATGQWLKDHGAGVLVAEPIETGLRDLFVTFGEAAYLAARAATARIPRSAVVDDDAACARIVAALAATPPIAAKTLSAGLPATASSPAET